MQNKTLRGWFDYLDDPKREYSETGFMMVMLFNIREYARMTLDLVREQKQATEHIEGMVGAIDDMFSRVDPNYAGDGKVRQALDEQRDERRKLRSA